MSIIGGFLRPDLGAIHLRGAVVLQGDSQAMRKKGVTIVHQHFMLVPRFTVAENLLLDQMESAAGLLDQKSCREAAQRKAAEVGWTFDFNAVTGDLPVGVQQRIEILKALIADSEIIILDEPTAVLSPGEVDDLFRVLRILREAGRTIILIAHKLDEVYAIADVVTVLRKGEVTGRGRLEGISRDQILRWMVGDLPPSSTPISSERGQVLLAAKGITVLGDRRVAALQSLDLEVAEGEIVGLGGVDGNGQLELAEALAGVRPIHAGVLTIEGRAAYMPQDRQRDGLALDMSIWENLLFSSAARGFYSPRMMRRRGRTMADAFDVKYDSIDDPIRSLSGGNQQKIVAARVMSQQPSVLIVMNPTRGLDVKATRFVHDQIRRAAQSGMAVLLISTDLDELAALSHRTLFLRKGQLVEGVEAMV